MKSGGHGGSVRVVNKTKHGLSHLDLDAIKKKAPKGAKEMIVEETEHRGVDYHALALRYRTKEGTFLYCKAAGGNFSDVFEQLKSCKKE